MFSDRVPVEIEQKNTIINGINIPIFQKLKDCSIEDWEYLVSEVMEWFGLVEMNAEISIKSCNSDKTDTENFVSTYKVEAVSDRKYDLETISMKGLFRISDVTRLFQLITKEIADKDDKWFFIHISGHSESSLSSGGKERSNYMDSANESLILVLGDRMIIMRVTGDQDKSL